MGQNRALVLATTSAAVLLTAGAYLYSAVVAPRIGAGHTAHPEIEFLHDPNKDPTPGARVTLPVRDAFGRKLPKFDGDLLVVWAESCQTCTLDAVSPRTIDDSPYAGIVVFFAEEESVLKKSFSEPIERWYVCSDTTGHWRVSLNASWSPRYYLFSSDGKLKRLQESWRWAPDFVRFR